ncbi:MAG: hypothetical protein Q8L08_03015 [Candidatus Nanopelagicaceae bacterium]|nr:hypothetical protein [Candidatus Nanopelagicaceae bacterium]
MALSRWISRKSFGDAMLKAEQLKIAAEAKERRNSGLFTEAQQNLRRELQLHDRDKPSEATHTCLYCHSDQLSHVRIKPSRSMTTVRITRK